jgi:hypothetical protein
MYHPYAGYFWLDSVRAIPTRPADTTCWDNHQFNIKTLVWENKGTKPVQPTKTNCWDNYQFDATACAWSNKGSQPLQPTDTIYVYQFDSVKCLWDNIGLKDSSSLSLREQELKELFWPNPFNDRIEISLTPGSYGTFTNIEGKTIQVFEVGTISIDTQMLQPGTYFLNITKDRQTISLKAIKN